ncbi:MAG: hypothetical protein M1822_005110 [Bathelium mastoideum]|nr:MAG: hypothetical protein M1822_005110 [Bathelium mastoideum]
MCKNLVEKGRLDKPLIIYNRTTKRAEDLAKQLPTGKTEVASSIDAAVKSSDIIFTCVGDDKAITDTIDACLKGDPKDKLFVDCSTVHPDTTNALAKTISAKGAGFVAFFGAPAMADSGQLVLVLAGPASSVDKVKPYCTGVMGRAIIDFSDQQHGRATHLKIIGNTFILNMVETLAEGHALAEKSGLGSNNLHQFIETMFPGPYVAYSNRMTSGDYHKREEPLFAVDLARKDARHATDLAKSAGVKMGDVEVADNHLKMVKEHMGSRGDLAGIYGAVRKESGLRFEV